MSEPARNHLWRMPVAWALGVASSILMVVVFATEALASLRGEAYAMPVFVGAIVVPPAAMLGLALRHDRRLLASGRWTRRPAVLALLLLEWLAWCVLFQFLLPFALVSVFGI